MTTSFVTGWKNATDLEISLNSAESHLAQIMDEQFNNRKAFNKLELLLWLGHTTKRRFHWHANGQMRRKIDFFILINKKNTKLSKVIFHFVSNSSVLEIFLHWTDCVIIILKAYQKRHESVDATAGQTTHTHCCSSSNKEVQMKM